MNPLDRVSYTESHRKWLASAGRWGLYQRPFLGTVISVDGQFTTVSWDMHRPWPKKSKLGDPHPSLHLAENLEVQS